MRTPTLITGLALVAALVAAPGAAGASTKLDSFSGSCTLRGSAAFTPPATNQQQRLDVRYRGPGTCTGSLNGRAISNAPVRVAARAQADGSCLRAKTLAPGSFRLEFGDGTKIRGSYEFDFVGTEGSVTVKGRRSGSASGHGTFVTDRTPPDLAAQCAGKGAKTAPLDISLSTNGPLVSERRRHRQHSRPRRPLTLEGDCDFSGVVEFRPPLTTTTRPVAQRVRGRGTCSGTLTDEAGVKHELDGTPAAYVARAPAQEMSCNSGTPKGTGAIVLRWGRLDFTSSETRVGAAPILTLRGTRGGSALVTGAATDSPATLLQECGGDGVDKAGLRGHLSTLPSISG